MSYPTRLQIKTRYLQRLDQPPLIGGVDPPGAVFTDAIFQEAFGEAFDALYSAFLSYQVPRIEIVQDGIILPPLTASLTPAQAGIANFGDFDYLAERAAYSTDTFVDLNPVDRLTQRAATDRLAEFCYRNATFYFVGATSVRELRLGYDSSGQAPTLDTAQIAVDSSLTFLSNYAVGVSARQKGYEEVGSECMMLAVGPRYHQGIIGGELFRLVQPAVRSRQNVQIARKPFSASRFRLRPAATPYIASQPMVAGMNATNVPVEFSTANATIVGAVDGVNLVFVLILGGVQHMEVSRNGVLQTVGVDYTSINNQITFVLASVPQIGDIITAEATF
jgi:hypothetical protein